MDANDKEMCIKVRDLVYSDTRILALGISHPSVSTILNDRLGMRKLTARWVRKSPSNEQMATRVCKVAVNAVGRNGYELIPHFAYSPDLASCDVFLFPNLKKLYMDVISGLTKKLLRQLRSGSMEGP